MKITKFKTGDRVTVKLCEDNFNLQDKSGVIISANGLYCTVLFDEPDESLHSGLMEGLHGDTHNRCWYFMNDSRHLKYEEKEEVKVSKPLYNGKVVCINPRSTKWTKGKIYKFTNGCVYYDDGVKLTITFETFEQFNNWSTADWLEVVE